MIAISPAKWNHLSVSEKLHAVSDDWFLLEPVFFTLYCSLELRENLQMACPVRTGRGRLEYNPTLVSLLDSESFDLTLRAEMLRILLKHPYGRQPENCCGEAISRGSDCVLTDNYNDITALDLDRVADLNLPSGESFEWYARRIQEMLPPRFGPSAGPGQDAAAQDDDASGDPECSASKHDHSALWEENQMMQERINSTISSIKNWGSVSGKLRETIIASTKPKIDYRRAFAGFRSSVLSSRRHLTRMRPNRRTDFEQMGAVHELSTRLLVAVDVSGSISSEMISRFYGLINRFFKYGIEAIDVVQFDASLGEVVSIKKATSEIEVCGRGGTSFQPAVDYAASHAYDGLVFLTDGYADEPEIPLGFNTPMLWVLESEECFEHHKHWISELPRCRSCWIRL